MACCKAVLTVAVSGIQAGAQLYEYATPSFRHERTSGRLSEGGNWHTDHPDLHVADPPLPRVGICARSAGLCAVLWSRVDHAPWVNAAVDMAARNAGLVLVTVDHSGWRRLPCCFRVRMPGAPVSPVD